MAWLNGSNRILQALPKKFLCEHSLGTVRGAKLEIQQAISSPQDSLGGAPDANLATQKAAAPYLYIVTNLQGRDADQAA
jgi:hypothetical protein